MTFADSMLYDYSRMQFSHLMKFSMAFTHQPMPSHPSLIASYCSRCRSFVAASPRPNVLKSAEQAHMCNQEKSAKKTKTEKKQKTDT